jgi:hypothetical protein
MISIAGYILVTSDCKISGELIREDEEQSGHDVI